MTTACPDWTSVYITGPSQPPPWLPWDAGEIVEGRGKRDQKPVAASWPEPCPRPAGGLGRQRAASGHHSGFLRTGQANGPGSSVLSALKWGALTTLLILGATPGSSFCQEPSHVHLNVSHIWTFPSAPCTGLGHHHSFQRPLPTSRPVCLNPPQPCPAAKAHGVLHTFHGHRMANRQDTPGRCLHSTPRPAGQVSNKPRGRTR